MKKKNELSDFKKKFGYILEYKINNQSNLMREDFEDDTIEGQIGEADEQTPEPKPAPSAASNAEVKPDPAIEQPKSEPTPAPLPASNEPTNVDVNIEPQPNPNNDLMGTQVQFMEKFITALDGISVNIEVINQKMDKYQQELNKMRMDVEEVREPTDEEKMEMRAMDSYPYNQRVSDIFGDRFRKEEPKKEFTTEFIPNANVNDRRITDSFNDF